MFLDFSDKQDAQLYFDQLKRELPVTAASPDGAKIIAKFTVLAKTATTEGTFKDMIKIIWRMIKPMTGTPLYRLTLVFLAIGAMCTSLASSSVRTGLPQWIENMETWLGKQLTIGGKGVAGEGEGTANDRVQRFFSTPYLHDFD